MLKRFWIVAACASALLAVPAAAQGYTPVFEPGECPFPDLERVSCGTLIVPEDRADPTGAIVELAVAILAPADGSTGNTPVIFLDGGPGGSALSGIDDFLQNPVNASNELILIDQRGTGFSQPSLNCPEVEEEEGADPLASCYSRLTNAGVNLSAYNSVTSAADINDLRLALGYEQVNLWGISYGTRLGLSVMRYHPEGVRAAVLDSVFPPEINATEQAAEDTVNAFETLFAVCAADPICDDAYPDLRETFYDIVLNFNDDPPLFLYYDIDDEYDLELYGDDVLGSVFQTLYNSEAIPMLPYGIVLLSEASDDFDYTDAVDILAGYYTPESWEGEGDDYFAETIMESDMVLDYLDAFGDITDSEGLFTSVTCAEEIGFEDENTAYDAAEEVPEVFVDFVLSSVDFAFLDCDTWQVDTVPDVEATRVQSNIPTLLISGGLDPVTPPSYGDSALAGLPNGTHIVFPFGAHSETSLPGCGASLVAAYFADPSAPPDSSCIPQAIAWYLD